ncbi:Na/Pi cotransporter family protein [Faecalibacterium prausnitzii]|uniref:Na+/phosphate symporter n=1 Tax=Faecalibacterium prausnitzii TaxID=853 RepID=A0A2A7ATI3_9FIRM|nr:Na/Pi cotransporter family protein [Faecalibacterium prausnitzii]PDX82351.1 Na+/phosphate symporter [Faecalibacterium prausnitzii]
MDITHITSLLGGIALFLYGMSIMGAGLEKLAGGKMQGVLQKLTSSTIKGVIFGTLITGVIQSSAGTVVICVGLVNSGIMTLTQSVGVIMGANIGTTVTGQLIRMADISGDSLWLTLIQPKTFAPVVAFIGCIFYVFLRNAKKKNIGQIMLGFGILFTGMSLMDSGVSPLRESAAFQDLFVSMTNPILGILVGVVATVIIQSSSASVGILQALSSTGLVTFGSAIPIILGAHIGTAFTPLLTIGGSSKDGKRTALIHLYFNIIGSVVLLAAIYAVRYTIGIPVWNDVMNKSSIANIHTLSSVVAMILFLPFSRVLSRLAVLTVPDSAEEAQELSMPVLDERLFKSPAVALQQAKNAVVKMSRRAARNVNLAAPLLIKMDEDVVSAINVRENLIDRMEVEVSNYLIKMTDQELGDDESHAVTELLNFVTEYERIGDYAVNIMKKSEELYEKEASFSDHAKEQLKLLTSAMERILDLTNDAFENDDLTLARQVEPLEEVIDIMVEKLRDQHIKRLKDGICSIDTGVVFLDVLNNAERISDHCSNIAARLVGMSEGDDYDSHTLKSLMHHNPTKEYSLHYEQCCKEYLVPLEAMEA